MGFCPKFWTDAAQNVKFSSFPEKKQKRHFFTLPKTSIHAKNQKIPMRGFGENLADGNDRQRDRDEGEFIGPKPPGPTNCKVSEKSNERISRYFQTDGRKTNGRTNEG